jgi:hypothetical protein
MDNIPPDLHRKIIQASKAGVSAKLLAQYLGLPLRAVAKVIAQDEHQRIKLAELTQWSALIGHNL